jgi:uncharacterized protein (DUF1778 family)
MVNASSTLMVRLDSDSKTCVTRAAELRHVSVSDYVRSVVVAQAQREIDAAEHPVITLTPDEQRAFWQALQEPGELTAAPRALGALMRGEWAPSISRPDTASSRRDEITRGPRSAAASRPSTTGSRPRHCRIRTSTSP